MAAVMLLSLMLAACAPGGGGSATTTAAATQAATAAATAAATTAATTAAATQAAAPVGEDWRTPYKDTVTVTIANNEATSTKWYDNDTIFHNIWTERWLDTYNIKVETSWASAEYGTKLNLAIASKELPDMFYCDVVQFQQLIDGNVIADISDVYEEYVYDELRKMNDNDPASFGAAKRDGKLYAIPQLHYGYNCEPSHMWLKKNWYEAEGSPEIKTLADFEDLMRTYMKTYNKDFAFPLAKKLEQFFFMANTWKAYPQLWVDDGAGNCIYGGVAAETKDMLADWARWYKEGILRSDWATLDFDTMKADWLNDEVGVVPGANWYSWQFTDCYNLGGDDNWFEAYNLPSKDGSTIMHGIPFLQRTYNVVTRTCKNPEVLIKLNNDYVYLMNVAVREGSLDIGYQGRFGENNYHHITGPFKLTFDCILDVDEIWEAVNTNNRNMKFSTGYGSNYYNEIMKWIDNKEAASLGRYLQMAAPTASLKRGNGIVERNEVMYNKLWGPPPDILNDMNTLLAEILNEGYTKIIMGIEPVDYFDTLVEEWKTAGGTEVTDAVNAIYGKK